MQTSIIWIACATYQGASPFLVDLKPKAKQGIFYITNRLVKIVNYEKLNLYVYNSTIIDQDLGFTIDSLTRNYSCALGGSCLSVHASFKPAKHAKYLYKATVVGSFDNFVSLYINGSAYTSYGENPFWNDYQPKGYITFLNQAPVNSSFNISVFVKDDGSPDNMSCYISLTLYYK